MKTLHIGLPAAPGERRTLVDELIIENVSDVVVRHLSPAGVITGVKHFTATDDSSWNET